MKKGLILVFLSMVAFFWIFNNFLKIETVDKLKGIELTLHKLYIENYPIVFWDGFLSKDNVNMKYQEIMKEWGVNDSLIPYNIFKYRLNKKPQNYTFYFPFYRMPYYNYYSFSLYNITTKLLLNNERGILKTPYLIDEDKEIYQALGEIKKVLRNNSHTIKTIDYGNLYNLIKKEGAINFSLDCQSSFLVWFYFNYFVPSTEAYIMKAQTDEKCNYLNKTLDPNPEFKVNHVYVIIKNRRTGNFFYFDLCKRNVYGIIEKFDLY